MVISMNLTILQPIGANCNHIISYSGVESIVISENSLEDAYNHLTTGGEAWSNEKLKGSSEFYFY